MFYIIKMNIDNTILYLIKWLETRITQSYRIKTTLVKSSTKSTTGYFHYTHHL